MCADDVLAQVAKATETRDFKFFSADIIPVSSFRQNVGSGDTLKWTSHKKSFYKKIVDHHIRRL